ncbi:MAG: type II toxin-antitoxin system HicB family antitoxin [Parcubacteria group bacterium]|nr:type II toxin-antitoxin system HicB family antitoxin [Parcubacteria group bacterium]
MNKREFTAVYQKKGRWVVAWIEEIPGVNTQGRTFKEAKENLIDALRLIVELNRSLAAGKSAGARRESLQVALPA